MDKPLRSRLYTAVVRCRSLLEEDFAQQLEGQYGVHAGGLESLDKLTHLDSIGRADREAIEATLQHYRKADATVQQAVERFVRESAFTFLNRLAALKLMEHPSRGLIQESIGRGEQSKGVQQLGMVSPEAVRAQPDGGYRLYLELLFDDLSHVLGILFDRSLPTSLLFPTQPCLQEVLALLNDGQLESVWEEDETIGWIYQYFTPGELRDQARKASGAPRNSYEMAFRNQFYTPHYVVRFLADNTLGRLWWEMRGGDTALVDSCSYLIRRDGPQTRAKRDPRSLRILDPAAGSGHFLLYCFDLLLTIYQEAYDDAEAGAVLRADYPAPHAFRRALPGLILDHNLHGIDIDRRACQIATLALWLRAQRAYHELGLKPRERPALHRIHMVDAEPLPGDYSLLGDFARNLRPAALGNMLRELWPRMELAGEVGSLLRIEQEIHDVVQGTQRALQALPSHIQLQIFTPEVQQPLQLDPADLDDKAFWENAVHNVVAALHDYATAAGGKAVARRLFADDAAQGMAFIELLRQPYDVVLMNPPFGAASVNGKEYINRAYPRTKNDLYAAFVERGLELLRPGGLLGAITSRTGFFLTSFQKWREEILLQECRMIALADLGYGVLDTAMVETAAYALEKK
ncbi:MAG: SAM-dependent methyltransferase [Chloroflexota bacterium]|nr:SAM-dependent methyltransferase [Chloroflexota bacterium]